MNYIFKNALFALMAIVIGCSCDDDSDKWPSGPVTVPSGGLQATAGSLTIGMATNASAFTNANYLQSAVANVSQTTFENAMKYGSIVRTDGSLNFTDADAQMQAVTGAGIKKVWGHTLCWYQQNNTAYLGPIAIIQMPNLAPNNSFEDWPDATKSPTGWTFANGGTYFSQGVNVDKTPDGTNCVQISGYGANGDSGWRVQLKTTFPTVAGHIYSVTFYAKGSSPDCKYQGEWVPGSGAKYTGDKPLSTEWTKYTFAFSDPMVADAETTTIQFDMAVNPGGSTVWLDNVVITDETALEELSDPVATSARVDEALKTFITGTASHFKGQVVGWDVINELFADNGSIRNNTNTANTGSNFVWSHYLGKNIGITAFKTARAADPNALLFINEYGIEGNSTTSAQKLDSLISYVTWLKDQKVPIDGIGTEMHINIGYPRQGMDYMFQKLAATGLKVRISELDVSLNVTSNFVLTTEVLAEQRMAYQNVVESYLANVPAEQRQDITIWGVNDSNSWKYNNGKDFPLLFDENFVAKQAYQGFLDGLKTQ